MAQEPKVGDFVVTEGRYSYSVYEVVGLTKKLFDGRQPGWGERRKWRNEIRFVGTEEQCSSLASALNSIVGKADSLRGAWLKQHNEETKTEISAAIAKATGSA